MKLKSLAQKGLSFLRSNAFFYLIVALFVLNALWFAFTSRYPMAFDENYHYGIIQQYAQQWSPFISEHAAGTESLGDIVRYPSYLAHYLQSFPYRFIGLFTDSDAVRILMLRLINIGVFAAALVVFKKMFEKTNLSPILANMALYVFIMIPTVPFLAAHVSYDNFSILLTAVTLLLAVDIINALKKKQLATNHLLLLIAVGCFNSLVKYTYLPIFVAVCAYLLIASIWAIRRYQIKPLQVIQKNFLQLSVLRRTLLVVLVLVSALLCAERYGINMVRYGQPVPDCAHVRSEAECMQYGPWGRDYELKQRFEPGSKPPYGPYRYTKMWASRTMREFFFTIRHDYDNVPPLRPISTFAWAMLAVGLGATLLRIITIFKNPYTRFFFITCAAYVIAIWLDNFGKYNSVHFPVAVHARYLFPLYPILCVLLGFASADLLSKLPRISEYCKAGVVALTLLAMLYGGGASSYIVQSDATWYWNNSFIIKAGDTARTLLSPIIRPSGVKPAIF